MLSMDSGEINEFGSTIETKLLGQLTFLALATLPSFVSRFANTFTAAFVASLVLAAYFFASVCGSEQVVLE